MARMLWMQRAEVSTWSQTKWRMLCRETSSMFKTEPANCDITCGQCFTSSALDRVHRWVRLWGETNEESESQRKMKIAMGTGNPEKGREGAAWKHAKALQHSLWANEHSRVELMRRKRQPRPTHTLSLLPLRASQYNPGHSVFRGKSQENVTSSMQLFSRSSYRNNWICRGYITVVH